MCPTEEYAMRRLTSVCTRQQSEPTTMPATASTPSAGASATAPSGSTGSATRTRPYVPIFSSAPASSTEPTVGASVCASGSQVCTGHSGLFTANPANSAAKASTWVPRAMPAPPRSDSATRSKVPVAE